MTNDVPNRTLPYPPNDGSTHWAGCWRAPLHHNCAVLEADALLDALDREREANRELREAGAPFVRFITDFKGWPDPAVVASTYDPSNETQRVLRYRDFARLRALLHPEDASAGGKA